MSRILFDALRRDAANLASESIGSLGLDDSPEAIHRHRIATKKIRSLWIASRPVAGPELAASSCDHLRDTARLLASARSAHVSAKVVEWMAKNAGRRQRRAVSRVANSFESLLGSPVPTEQSITAFRSRMEEALQALEQMPEPVDNDPDRLILVDGIGRTYRKTRRFARHALTLDTPKGYHRLRRWVKFLRYQLEWLDSLGIAGPEDTRVEIEKLGHRLGQLHDVQEVRAFFVERSTKLARPRDYVRVDRLLGRREANLKGRALRLGKRALKRRPRRFNKRLLKMYEPFLVHSAEANSDEPVQSDHERIATGEATSSKSSRRRTPAVAS